MADQTVKISNLPDKGSREAVAFDLAKYIREAEWSERQTFSRDEFLDLYSDCLHVTSGYRLKK